MNKLYLTQSNSNLIKISNLFVLFDFNSLVILANYIETFKPKLILTSSPLFCISISHTLLFGRGPRRTLAPG